MTHEYKTASLQPLRREQKYKIAERHGYDDCLRSFMDVRFMMYSYRFNSNTQNDNACSLLISLLDPTKLDLLGRVPLSMTIPDLPALDYKVVVQGK